MGNEANSINQQSSAPRLTKPTTFKSDLANLPESTVTDRKRVLFASGTKKSLPKAISDRENRGRWSTRARDSGKDEMDRLGIEKLGMSNSSKMGMSNSSLSSFNNTPTTFEDSSSMIVINRTAKNSKLMPPPNSPSKNYLQKPRGRSGRDVSAERSKVIDLWEYSSEQRDMISSKSSIGNYWLNPIDDNASCDFNENSKNANRFSFGESANYRSNSNYFGDGRISTETRLSELSLPGRQLNISFTRRASDSITISWPHGAAPTGESSVPHWNCLSCGTYTVNDMGLPKPEYKQKPQRTEVKSNFLYGSALGVRPLKNKFPHSKTQKVTESVKTNVQTPLSIQVIRAD